MLYLFFVYKRFEYNYFELNKLNSISTLRRYFTLYFLFYSYSLINIMIYIFTFYFIFIIIIR